MISEMAIGVRRLEGPAGSKTGCATAPTPIKSAAAGSKNDFMIPVLGLSHGAKLRP
jgi:hypothetical protein